MYNYVYTIYIYIYYDNVEYYINIYTFVYLNKKNYRE